MSNAIPTAPCNHDWHRVPERDRVYGHRDVPGPEYAVFIFWCSKCLQVQARRVEYTEDAKERA